MGRIDRDPSADDDQAVTDTKNDLGHGLLGTQDTWSGIRIALKNGARGLPRPITLADFLWEKRGVPNKANRPKLSVEQILKWIDEHKKQQGVWPDQNSGPVQDTVESWRGIDVDFQSMALLGNANNADIQFLRNMQSNIDGVIVMHVDPNSPAFGKIKVGELITSVDGKTIKSPREFREAVKGLSGKVILKTPESDIEIPE